QRRKYNDPRNAAADVPGVAREPIGHGIEASPQHLAKPDEHEGDDQEKCRRDQLDRHDELAHIRVARFRAEEDFLWRGLAADIEDKAAPVMVNARDRDRRSDSAKRDEGEIAEPIVAPPRSQAAAGHAEKRS